MKSLWLKILVSQSIVRHKTQETAEKKIYSCRETALTFYFSFLWTWLKKIYWLLNIATSIAACMSLPEPQCCVNGINLLIYWTTIENIEGLMNDLKSLRQNNQQYWWHWVMTIRMSQNGHEKIFISNFQNDILNG